MKPFALLLSLVVLGVGVSLAYGQSTAPVTDTPKLSAPVATEVAWQIKDSGSLDVPSGMVSLVVGDKTYRIRKVTGHPAEKKLAEVDWAPKTAVLVLDSWWAGSGDQFYVVKRGKKYLVYHRDLDEQAETGKFKLIKTVRA